MGKPSALANHYITATFGYAAPFHTGILRVLYACSFCNSVVNVLPIRGDVPVWRSNIGAPAAYTALKTGIVWTGATACGCDGQVECLRACRTPACPLPTCIVPHTFMTHLPSACGATTLGGGFSLISLTSLQWATGITRGRMMNTRVARAARTQGLDTGFNAYALATLRTRCRGLRGVLSFWWPTTPLPHPYLQA